MARLATTAPVRRLRSSVERFATSQLRVQLAEVLADNAQLKARVHELNFRLARLEALFVDGPRGGEIGNLIESLPEALRQIRRDVDDINRRTVG